MISIGFPSSYIQGSGLLENFGELVSPIGKKPLVIADAFVRELYGERLKASLFSAGCFGYFAEFKGECSPSAIDLAVQEARDHGCDCVIGFGGGKAIDTAKGVKIEIGFPVIVAPTIASNDSPTSRLAITYTESGAFIGPRFLASNPELIIVDTAIIAQAPARFFVAGIGDALVTKFEAEQCLLSGTNNFFGGASPQAAICLADLCYRIVREHGESAVQSIKAKVVNDAVEKVTEANILLSGLGFEACGVAGAHAIGMAFSLLPEVHGTLHGEEVAVGLIVQFVLEGRDEPFIFDMLEFYQSIGLSASLKDIGLNNPTDEQIRLVADFAARSGSRLHNMSRPMDSDIVFEAIKKATAIVEDYRSI